MQTFRKAAALGTAALGLVAVTGLGGCPTNPSSDADALSGVAAAGNSSDTSVGGSSGDDSTGDSSDSGDTGDNSSGDSSGSDLSGGSISISADGAVTVTYQQGKDGYSSAKAVDISTLYAESYNQFQGTLFTDDTDWCIGDMPARDYNIAPLIRFEDLNIPAGSTVIAASLSLTFVDVYDGGGQRVVGHYLNVPWALEQTYGGGGVGWAYRDTGLPWTVPGARGEGTDVIAGKSFMSKVLSEGAYQTDTIALDATVVQMWVNDPSRNYGIVLTVDQDDHHVGFRQPQNAHADDRPVLSITYVPVDGGGAQ